MKFDPLEKRRILDEFSIGAARSDEYREAFLSKSLEGTGSDILSTAIQCHLVGYFDTGRELMRKAWSFLNAAVEHREVFGIINPHAAEEVRLSAFTLCDWFVKKRHDREKLQQAVRARERWFDETGDKDKYEVQLTLPLYLEAEAYDALFHRFAAAELKVPASLPRIRPEGTMSYVLARHRLGLEYTDDEVVRSLRSFLKRNVFSEWLSRGQYDTAARWMKIAHWKPGDDPIATLLKCYDYMDQFETPQYP